MVDSQDAREIGVVLQARLQGTVSEKEFLRFAALGGVYALRGGLSRYMVRIKLPAGMVAPAQLEAVAALVDSYTPGATAHLTTRQDVELHGVPEESLAHVCEDLAAAGLTSANSGGPTVRNVTCCPLAGLAPGERFDVTPYALAVARYFQRHPEFTALPRKVKIGFEGCEEDHARIAVHDIGVQALPERQTDVREFLIFVGGGLGGAPMAGQILEPFTPEELLLPTCVAILRIFNAHGNRGNRHLARLKFLVKDWGLERFRNEVLSLRDRVAPELPRTIQSYREEHPLQPPQLGPEPYPPGPDFQRWLRENVLSTRQQEYAAVWIRCPLGDLSSAQLRCAASSARKCGVAHVRTSNDQNLLLRWVPKPLLAGLFRELESAGLALAGAERAIDVTRCVGGETCPSALTESRALAAALERILANGCAAGEHARKVRIKVSGCPHGCSHHLLAEIGLCGVTRRAHGRVVPCYRLHVRGGSSHPNNLFGKPVATVPAYQAVEAVRHVLLDLVKNQQDESFAEYIERVGVQGLQDQLAPFEHIPPPEAGPEYYRDLGKTEEYRAPAPGQDAGQKH